MTDLEDDDDPLNLSALASASTETKAKIVSLFVFVPLILLLLPPEVLIEAHRSSQSDLIVLSLALCACCHSTQMPAERTQMEAFTNAKSRERTVSHVGSAALL